MSSDVNPDDRSFISKITSSIAGNTKPCELDSPIREELKAKSLSEDDLEIAPRYMECSTCEHLCEEFKLLGLTISENTPQCSQCGCNLNVKIPLKMFHCPLERW